MPFWRFGKNKDPKDVELTSRVVTATSRDGKRLRGKVTLHFTTPVTQLEATDAADRFASASVQALGEVVEHQRLMPDHPQADAAIEALIEVIRSKAPPQAAATVRHIEVAALHIVGDMSSSAVRVPTANRLATVPSAAGSTPSRGTPAAEGSQTPTSSVPPPRRPSSSQMFAVTADRIVPPGATVDVAGRAIAPIVRDTAGRLLIGTLRCYDLLFIRELNLDEGSGLLGALVPASDVSVGDFEQSRADELARWDKALGEDTVDEIRSEVRVASTYLAFHNLNQAGVPPGPAAKLIEAMVHEAFPDDPAPLVEMGRYLQTAESTSAELAAHVAKTVDRISRSADLEQALSPLLSSLSDDLGLAAAHVKASVTFPNPTVPPSQAPPDQSSRPPTA